MQRSTSSHFDQNESESSFGSLSGSGADLSRYQDQLARERNSRTLNLRRKSRVTIAGVIQSSTNNTSFSHNNLVDGSSFPFLDPNKFVEIMRTNSTPQIIQLVQNIETVSQHSPRLLKILLSSSIVDFIAEILSNDVSKEINMQILRLIIAIFPHCGELQTQFVDSFIFSIQNILDLEENDIVLAAISVVAVISSCCEYARDSLLCYEFHIKLIQLATDRSPEITQTSCQALLNIFTNPANVESQILKDAVRPLASLINTNDCKTIICVIECFVGMSNIYTSIIFDYFNAGLYPIIVQMLQVEELVSHALGLIGNLSVGEPPQEKALLDAGLCPMLMGFLHTEHAANAFWVLSNLLQGATQHMLPFFGNEFVQRIIEIAGQSGFEVKKEASFFLATLILLTSPTQNVTGFMNAEVVDILVDMLGCGVPMVVIRCLQTFFKLLHFTQMNLETCHEFFSQLLESDLRDRVQELLELYQSIEIIVNLAGYISRAMDTIEGEMAA